MNKKPNKKIKSTYEEFIEAKTPEQRKQYEAELKDFILSELILAAMEQDFVSVRKLAKLAGISPIIVQEMRSGSKTSFNIKSFFKVLKSLGYNFLLEKNGQITPIDRIPSIRNNFDCDDLLENLDFLISYHADINKGYL